MNDYSKYSYARSLQFFEAYYPYDTEKVNYAELMLSMNKLSTIDELLSIRNRIIPDNQEKKDNTPTWIYVVSGIVILAILILIAPVIDVLLPWLLVFGFMFWLLGKY